MKSQIMNEAWNNPRINENRQGAIDCCETEHLPHNELNPRCYKNASGLVGKIPYAG